MSCHAITVVRNEVFRVRKNGGGSYITALDLVSNFLTDFNAARTNPGWRLPVGWLLLAAIIGCGPPLTDPSSKNMSGIWTSTLKMGAVSNVQMTVTQSADGAVQGTWVAALSPLDPVCPPGLNGNPTGPVSGTNTILEVRLSLLGIGDFTGQLDDSRTLRGSFQSCGAHYEFVFNAAPTG